MRCIINLFMRRNTGALFNITMIKRFPETGQEIEVGIVGIGIGIFIWVLFLTCMITLFIDPRSLPFVGHLFMAFMALCFMYHVFNEIIERKKETARYRKREKEREKEREEEEEKKRKEHIIEWRPYRDLYNEIMNTVTLFENCESDDKRLEINGLKRRLRKFVKKMFRSSNISWENQEEIREYFLNKYLEEGPKTQFSSAHFAMFLDIVLDRNIKDLTLEFYDIRYFSTVMCKFGEFSKLPYNRKFLTKLYCILFWNDVLADSALEFSALSNVVRLTVQIEERMTDWNLSQLGMLRLKFLTLIFNNWSSTDHEQTVLSIFINQSLNINNLEELWKYQFSPDALQPICQTLTEFSYCDEVNHGVTGNEINLVAFILRHVRNFQRFLMEGDGAKIGEDLVSDAVLKISTCSETDRDIKMVSKMFFKGTLYLTKLPIKIKNNEEYEAIASITPMLKYIKFSAIKCDPAIIEIISKKYPWTHLRSVSFKDCHDEFIIEFLRVYGRQVRKVCFKQDFDCGLLYNVSVDMSSGSKGTLISKLKTLKCYGTMTGVPPKSLDHLKVYKLRSFQTTDQWRTIDQVLPNLVNLHIGSCQGLTVSLVQEIFPKFPYLMYLFLPRNCDGYNLSEAAQVVREAGIDLTFPMIRKKGEYGKSRVNIGYREYK